MRLAVRLISRSRVSLMRRCEIADESRMCRGSDVLGQPALAAGQPLRTRESGLATDTVEQDFGARTVKFWIHKCVSMR